MMSSLYLNSIEFFPTNTKTIFFKAGKLIKFVDFHSGFERIVDSSAKTS